MVTAPFLIFLDFRLGLRMAIGTSGIWWFCWQLYTFKHLKPRPGPPLPAGTSSYIGFSWSRFLLICKRARYSGLWLDFDRFTRLTQCRTAPRMLCDIPFLEFVSIAC